jgi:predicted nucleotidyltransferase
MDIRGGLTTRRSDRVCVRKPTTARQRRTSEKTPLLPLRKSDAKVASWDFFVKSIQNCGKSRRMNTQEIIARLREHEAALRARGVSHAALFGSRARGDARPDSDTDIMIEIDPYAPVGVYEYVGIKEYIASLFDGKVDVVDREGLKPYVRPAATEAAIYAF